MEIGRIQSALPQVQAGTREQPAGSTGFADLLGRALAQLQAISENANAKVEALATGQDVELHDVMVALEMESLAISLATEVRNKAVEAYQDIARMQI